jgi:hypothetical protein
MKKLFLALLLLPAAAVASPWRGVLDAQWPPKPALYQSLVDADQAAGVQSSLWSVTYGTQTLITAGAFAGATRAQEKIIAGPTVKVPGSLLDWTLGTSWGQAWLPKAKAGLLIGWDFTRPAILKAKPNFAGVGVAF